LDKARKDILKANNGQPPKVLDPFGGGGSIPLEALRLGCETYTGDLNPVAVLIQKATLEYPQKYGKPVTRNTGNVMLNKSEINPLLEDVKKWADWVLEEAKKDIGGFYPKYPDGSIPVGYTGARQFHVKILRAKLIYHLRRIGGWQTRANERSRYILTPKMERLSSR
jgi:hypothetical protein